MLTKRIISSIILIIIIIASLFINWLFGLLATLFIIFGLYEFFAMLENKRIISYKYFGIVMGSIIPLSLIFRFELNKSWELLFIVLGLLFLILMQFRRRENSGVVADISATIFGILYVSWFFSFLIRIRYFPGGSGLVAALLLITKGGDIGAYLIGSRFGKTFLIPRISPKKTLEGAAGGLFFSLLGAIASSPFLNFSFAHLLFLGIFLGLIGQLGDLSESLIKRDCQVKDSGRLFPGLGGVLDSMDSLLFTAPVFYFYLSIIFK
ncbi:MAG: hypothetical protein DRP74_01095 [Candidatus Omnitrophota bacterium]|nr:MAG: hypothetical protein DRP74_01095 [Candidatus Omnitrophota bacterium]